MPTSKLRDPISKSKNDSNQNSEPVAYTFAPIFDAASKIANDINEEERQAKQNAQNLENLENNPNEVSDQSTSAQEREESAEKPKTADWVNNTSDKKQDQAQPNGRFSFVKKKGPLTAIILTLVGGGLGIGGLLAPSSLLINIRNTITDALNNQSTSLSIRTKKILISKATPGVCTKIKIACKYSSMSEKQLSNFKDAGITVNYGETKVTTETIITNPDGSVTKTVSSELADYNGSQIGGTVVSTEGNITKNITTEITENTSFTGRAKPTSFEFNGKKITASDFGKELSSNVEFSAAVNKAYNPRFASFADKYWTKTLFTLKIDENGVKLGNTDKERAASIEAKTKNATGEAKTEAPKEEDYPDDPDGYKKAVEEYDGASAKTAKTVSEISDAAEEAVESNTKNATKVFKIATEAGGTASKIATSAVNTLKITGVVDDACMVYGSTRAVGYGAKVIRAAQFASYAMIFLTLADQAMAGGNPNPDDVSYVGSKLTTPSSTGKTATDGYGYRLDAYNETGAMSDEETQYLVGAGLAGGLIVVTQYINSILGKSPNTVCKISNNIFVQIGSFAIGVAAAVLTDGLSVSPQLIGKGLSSAAVAIALLALPAMLADIVAGVAIDNDTLGDLSYAAIRNGAATSFNMSAALGGNTALQNTDIAAYNELSNQVAQEYAKEDRLAYSPLDASNSNTFMGKVYSYVTPYISNMSSISSALSSVASFTKGSLASVITPKSAYASNNAKYNVCQDLDYINMGLATDPYCNLSYGVPVSVLENIEPSEVLEKLANSGDIDPDSGEIISRATGLKGTSLGQLSLSEYKEQCINRTQPYGYTGDDFSGTDGSECLVSDKYPMNKYYSLYFIDKRAEEGMSGEDDDLNTAMASGVGSNIAFYNGSNGVNNTTASSSFFAKIKDFFTNLFSKNSNESSYNNQTLSKVTVI